jgi:hypothetical protein
MISAAGRVSTRAVRRIQGIGIARLRTRLKVDPCGL